ncbi:hypothetical protein ID852_17585 [Xenorhabdus sp. 42]|uniref:hypothetical protein n=1 Tax=Xenorhabdus szentirmaii TaxID=290112 RepID=UPI0019AD1D9E|nr:MULTISPECIES: hypothetical protein [unclassified Xenorhabdus]MBD2792592.1 hypothetical protein [Xenorhabdus sp. CUL]MBD2822457.1 hypothetical protein [Xenorhabdus sp. 42]
MDFNFKNNSSFKDLIKAKEKEILKRTLNSFQETNEFKIFYNALLSYLNSRERLDMKLLLITKEDIFKLSVDFYINLESSLDSDIGIQYNSLFLNHKMEIVQYDKVSTKSDSNEARKLYAELSKDYLVFLLLPGKVIKYFIDGDDFGDGIFFTMADYISYDEKRPIERINELFIQYRQQLAIRNTYCKFFLSKSHIKSLRKDMNSSLDEKKFIEKYNYLLNNKPEDLFREDLRLFLNGKLKAVLLSKELILENFKRLDIVMLDESGSDFYLIEVKWVGTSVHHEGKMIGTSYDESDITPAAIKQSVSYINQLHKERKNIKIAYLAVFDAREDQDQRDTGTNINEDILDEEDKKFFNQFRKIDDFKVKNFHPN